MPTDAPLHTEATSLGRLRTEATAFERSLPAVRRKRLGQFFTTASVARLLAAISTSSEQTSVLDPMAGQGELLDWAWERIARGGASQSIVDAIEVDPTAAAQCDRRLRAAAEALGGLTHRVLTGDAFAPTTIELLSQQAYDLVITNPPYVRYQSLRTANGDGAASMGAVRGGLRAIASGLAPAPERELWAALIDGYSGLADLSVPAWLLSALLTRPGGTLALVVPAAWQTRDYAGVLRYLMVRCFDRVRVVSAAGRVWFEDAQVDTNLVVGRRITAPRAFARLDARAHTANDVVDEVQGDWTRVTLPEQGSANGSLVGALFPEPDPDAAFARALNDLESAQSRRGTLPESVLWQRSTRAVESAAVLAQTARARWRRASDGTSFHVAADAERPLLAAPPPIRELLASMGHRTVATEPASVGVRVGQGLRTGCNPFFYVEALGTVLAGTRVRTSALFGARELVVPDAVLVPVVRRQQEVRGLRLDRAALSGRALVLDGWYLPEDVTEDVGSDVRVLPPDLAAWIREAAATSHRTSDTPTLIPELTAVRPNAERPRGRWYMLPRLMARHVPTVLIARVSAETPRGVCNAEPPIVVDANFSTIWADADTVSQGWSGPAIMAVLNSAWGRACIEALGTPMGGGALKLEATHLRRFPWPLISAAALEHLERASDALRTSHNNADAIADVDRIVIRAVLGDSPQVDVSSLDIDVIRGALTTECTALRARRRRR